MNRILCASLACAALLPNVSAGATTFGVTALVSDDTDLQAASLGDAGLVDPWGIATSPNGPFWVANQGAGTATVYSVDPQTRFTSKTALTVTLPDSGNVSGEVFNPSSSSFGGVEFLFVSKDGTVSGWRPALGTIAERLATGLSDKVYTGAATGTIAGHDYLYATNFHSGAVDVLKGDSAAPTLAGSFVDPTLPAGYAAYSIANLGDTLYVSYALQAIGGRDPVSGAGLGIVDRYTLDGVLLGRMASGGTLDSPWGLALAPTSFGEFAGSLLVGNSGDGTITAMDPVTGQVLGQLPGAGGTALRIDGLHGLLVGNDGAGGRGTAVYFTAGPGAGAHGVFGEINAVPLAGSLPLLAVALVGLAGLSRRPREASRGI